ncbi:RNA polymerase subunit sigma [Corallococcus sp. H22C18031201]|uniref:sigma-70 family RNA polymerase sigma factor n=1 Tax=Citreicoccus inhibens TaxID=2849499 RepID=UPI000E73B0A1|nr:sigma-70 family RNA polymerase sigma factor [Citreicoccus inhibens]MBU8894827.1 sigma-70 family RNA polymerase sigma factor [Citreicoccus inhibens]RJS17673.1 RNA polymerase subunit sigma [Corallococcus sp. H22C18031201]
MAPTEPSAARASDPADDRALLLQVALGDSQAMRDVYARCAGRAFALCLRLLPARADAEELLQETFLEVWRRAREFDPSRGGMETWVATIARTRAIDRLRALGTVARTVEGATHSPPPVSATPVSPDVAVAVGEERSRVLAALRQLPWEQRHVVELAYFDGLTQREISARTGDPLGTVKTRARLALEKLSALLREPSR